SAESLLERAVVTPGALRLMRRFWPGPLTLVLRAAGGGTVGMRVPRHDLALSLLRETGPLWTTSANRSGEAEAMTADEAAAALPDLDAVLDGGRAPGGVPSTVVDLSGARPVLLREGAIPAAQLQL
ncbi:MAG TPA: Sua5/YciO/YrdC/YwlC family protein, partial [Candidatus Dormibacteraeota bacterium]